MSRTRSILLVVEGDKAEPELMRRVLSVYGITGVDQIYSYRANVYDLYRRMFEDGEDADDLSLTLALREREEDPSKRELLDRNYSDTILIFDYDPQDHLFSSEKLEVMLSYFDESTEHGKLYINYPMVEAYRDLGVIPYDDGYLSRTVEFVDLKDKAYKDIVARRSCLPRIDGCNVTVFNQILVQNIEKASHLVNCDYVRSDPACHYSSLTQEEILKAQAALLHGEAVVSVLCTCLWFVIDYKPKAMRNYLRSVASQG